MELINDHELFEAWKRRKAFNEERFWAKVIRPENWQTEGSEVCWNWNGAVKQGPRPYGHFWIQEFNRPTIAHRFSWEIANGIVPEGKCVLHRCDNPRCVNPKHLFLGDQHDNIIDCINKNRFLGGKLTIEQVKEIRRKYETSDKHIGIVSELAQEYGLSRRNMSKLVNYKNFAWVK